MKRRKTSMLSKIRRPSKQAICWKGMNLEVPWEITCKKNWNILKVISTMNWFSIQQFQVHLMIISKWLPQSPWELKIKSSHATIFYLYFKMICEHIYVNIFHDDTCFCHSPETHSGIYYLILIVNWIALTLCSSILLCSFKIHLLWYC